MSINEIKTKIWVFIPVYNGIEFVNEAMISLIRQSYRNFNVLFGINGHDEKTSKLLKDYLEYLYSKHDWVHIKIYETKGKSDTLNAMVKDTQSDYIALLDVDDFWHSSKLEIQVPLLDDSDYDVIGTECQYFGDRAGLPKLPVGDVSREIFNQYNPIINSSVLIRRSDELYWDKEYEGVEDYELWLRWNYKGKTFYNIQGTWLTFHRVHNSSYFNTKNFNDKIAKMKELWRYDRK